MGSMGNAAVGMSSGSSSSTTALIKWALSSRSSIEQAAHLADLADLAAKLCNAVAKRGSNLQNGFLRFWGAVSNEFKVRCGPGSRQD